MSTTDSNATTETVFMLRISLKNIKPEVWRRVLVPGDYTFKDLHDIIIAVMGWSDFHMHKFSTKHPETDEDIEIGGVGDLGYGDYLWLPEDTKIADYFIEGTIVVHEYDFGSPWYHQILFERAVPGTLGEKYPTCIEGEGSPPPEEDFDVLDSDYAENQEFDHTQVDMGRCRQKIAEISQKRNEVIIRPEKRTADNLHRKSGESQYVRKEVTRKPNMLKNDRLTPETYASPSKKRLIASGISNKTARKTVSRPVFTVYDVSDDSSPNSEQNSSIQSHMETETDQDVEGIYGKYIASQMRLVSDLEAREELRSEIQNSIRKYRFQKK